jgi:predicted  nucleic acid-binding Zn-ribbon protein
MNVDILVAVITATSTSLVAIVALALNQRSFNMLDRRIDMLDRRIDKLESRLERIEVDIKEFFRILALHDTRLSKLEDQS